LCGSVWAWWMQVAEEGEIQPGVGEDRGGFLRLEILRIHWARGKGAALFEAGWEEKGRESQEGRGCVSGDGR
jgi:hypothetical protein